MKSNNESAQTDANLAYDLKKSLFLLWELRFLIILIVLIFSLILSLVTLFIPNQYQSKAIVKTASPTKSVETNNSMLSLNLLGGNQIDPETKLALVLLESRIFFESLYDDDKFLAQMYAVKNDEIDVVRYDASLYNTENSLWIGEKPSLDEARNLFLEKHLSTEISPSTGYITISMIHSNPIVAMQWVDLVFNKLNSYVKNQKIYEANLALKYLKNEINNTNVSELRKIFADGINQQTKILMLSEITDDFVFQYIDPPFLPATRYSPMRSLIVLLGALASLFISVILILLLDSAGKRVLFRFKPFEIKLHDSSVANYIAD
jgi:LPS O-antigen subunit length determinant protein (WzzB/FepE family)